MKWENMKEIHMFKFMNIVGYLEIFLATLNFYIKYDIGLCEAV